MGKLFECMLGYVMALYFVGIPTAIIASHIKWSRKMYAGEKERKKALQAQEEAYRLKHGNRHH